MKGPWTEDPKTSQPSTNATATPASGPSWPPPPTGHLAEKLTAKAFARAWAHWRKVRKPPAPAVWVVRTTIPAGDFVTLVSLHNAKGIGVEVIGVNVGRQTTCALQYPPLPQGANQVRPLRL